jgi:hypothetical protein
MLNAVLLLLRMHLGMECPYHLFTFEIMMMMIMWPKLLDESELNHLMSHSIMKMEAWNIIKIQICTSSAISVLVM